MTRLPTNRASTPPGEILAEEFLKPPGLAEGELARQIGVPAAQVEGIVRGERAVDGDDAASAPSPPPSD